MNESIKDYGKRLLNALTTIDQNLVDEVYNEIFQRINSNNTIHFLGNGGSQANAHHIVGDYLKSFAFLGVKLNVNCIADNSCYITAASNDLDFQEVYSVLVERIINKGDLLVYLSGSGNSMNLIKCAIKAKSLGIKQISVTGFNGGKLINLVDIPIHIKTFDMEIAEDCQINIFHNLKQRLMQKVSKKEGKKNSNMKKYDKRTIEDLIA
tara:strand:+ start:490 stop:1116 length:627 start_codon:yes stop_codon:yes gene_type:complete